MQSHVAITLLHCNGRGCYALRQAVEATHTDWTDSRIWAGKQLAISNGAAVFGCHIVHAMAYTAQQLFTCFAGVAKKAPPNLA